jgi:HEAT repeat protein
MNAISAGGQKEDQPMAANGRNRDGFFQGKTIEQWREQLNDVNEAVRLMAAAAVGECGPQAVPALVEMLKNKDALIRYWAAKGLGKIGPEARSAAPALTEALGDPSESVQINAAYALWAIGEKAKGMAALIKCAKAKSAGARLAVMNFLSLIGPEAKEAIEAIKAAADVKDDDYVQDYVVRKANYDLKMLGAKDSMPE